ncbi:MAG: DUF4364 family protein [Eubacterium sp.]|nr:DUF4364 family protein [Eubacterium sp.]
MTQESLTLYKLMIMFMLDHLEVPLTNSQLSEFFVSRGYASYFHLQQSINDLVDSSFIRGELNRSITSYYLTESGREAIHMFENQISEAIKEDILTYFDQHHVKLRQNVEINADYYPTRQGEYIVRTQIREKDSLLLELNINVVTEDQAITICNQWAGRSEEVYKTIMNMLLLNAPAPEPE